MGNACPRSQRRIFSNPHLPGNLIGGFKADASNIPRQAIGVFRNHLDGISTIGLVNPDSTSGTDAVLIKKKHDLPNGFLILPAFNNHPGTMGADTCNCSKHIRCILDDIKHLNTKRLHQLLAIHRANAFNQAGTEIFLNSFFCSRCAGFQERSFKLQAIVLVIEPLA